MATPDLHQLRHVEEFTRMFGSSGVTNDEILDYIDNVCDTPPIPPLHTHTPTPTHVSSWLPPSCYRPVLPKKTAAHQSLSEI